MKAIKVKIPFITRELKPSMCIASDNDDNLEIIEPSAQVIKISHDKDDFTWAHNFSK